MQKSVLGKLPHCVAVAACAIALGACASGGGSSNSPSGNTGGNTGGTSGGNTGGNTGGTTVQTPAPATLGSNANAPQIADPKGPGFSSTTSMPAAGTAFPLKQTAIKINNNGWSLDTATNSGGATLTTSGTSLSSLALSVPSLGLSNKAVVNSTASLLNYLSNPTDGVLLYAPNTTFAIAGEWLSVAGSQGTLSLFTTGYQTPSSAMPHIGTGTATTTNVMGFALKSTDVAVLAGGATLSADFTTGAVTGTLNNMTATDTQQHLASKWNDVSIKANIASGSSSFSGTTGTNASPGTSFALNTSATGTVSGDFYGPKTDNVAGVWSIGDGNVAAFGTLMGNISVSEAPPGSVTTGGNLAPLTISAPEFATFGPGAIGSSLPQADGPTFDSKTGNFPTGQFRFQTMMTVLAQTNTTIQPAGGYAGIVTYTGTGADCSLAATCSGTKFSLEIPLLNYTLNVSVPSTLSGARGLVPETALNSLSYVAFGVWSKTPAEHYYTGYEPAIVFGYQTPDYNIPTTGAATYAGPVDGVVMVPTAGPGVTNAVLSGNANFNVNFASGAISGTFTGMSSKVLGGSATPWNDVSVSANNSGKIFDGTTSVTSAPGGANALAASAKGLIRGAFYGPKAEELGAVWSLSDGTSAAIGTVGGRKQ